MARTDMDLCNGAMIKLGKRPNIAKMDGEQAEERIFNQIFERTIKGAIRKYRPNCCVARAILSQDPNYIPKWGYASAYKYPDKMLKLLEIDGDRWDMDLFPIEGQWILSQIPKATESGITAPSIKVKYLEHKDTSYFDDDFANLCEYELAVAAAPVIDMTREAMIIALRNSEADRWAADNAQENGFTTEEYDPLFGNLERTTI